MILAPNNGSIGVQPAGTICRCIARETVAVGDVVVTSFGHSGALYPPADTVASFELSYFSNVVKAEGDQASLRTGFVGVVTALPSGSGASGQVVQVQFGGICLAKVRAASAVAVAAGNALSLSNTAGEFAIGDATDSTNLAAVALGAVTANTQATINVLLVNQPVTGIVV
jgi:hypothetical protein